MIACRFEDCLRDAGIQLTNGGREARLAPTVLFHNEESQKLALRDEITPALWAKVLFDLPSPGKIKEATLLWFVNQPPADSDAVWTILVNGRKIAHQQRVARLLTGGWDRCAVPGRFLKAGRNEVVFAGHGWLYLESAGRLQAKPSAFSGADLSESTLAGAGAGGRSLRSFDAGRTWHFNAAGPDRNQPGEYLVRLRAMGHPVAGSLTSPVADLGDPDGAGRIAPVMEIRSCRLAARRTAPAGTAILFEMRSGSTPAFDPKSWSAWRAAARLDRPGRFVQWRATLSSRRLDATPVVSRVTLKPEIKVTQPAADCRIAHWDRPELARSSYAFQWMAPNPRAQRLVKQYRLDEVVARGKTDLERLCLLRDWCWKQWFGWQSRDFPYCPSWDPFEILDTVKNNWGFGMCTHWSALYAACAGALGFHARIVVIDHHCLNEVWVDELGKWILMDSAGDNNFVWEIDGRPINALELHEAARLGHGRGSRSASGARPGSRGCPTSSAARLRSSAPASTSASRWKARSRSTAGSASACATTISSNRSPSSTRTAPTTTTGTASSGGRMRRIRSTRSIRSRRSAAATSIGRSDASARTSSRRAAPASWKCASSTRCRTSPITR